MYVLVIVTCYQNIAGINKPSNQNSSYRITIIYIRHTGGDLHPQRVTDSLELAQLTRISTDVGKDWKMLGRRLGLDETTISTIHNQSNGDLAEASLQSLLRYGCVFQKKRF